MFCRMWMASYAGIRVRMSPDERSKHTRRHSGNKGPPRMRQKLCMTPNLMNVHRMWALPIKKQEANNTTYVDHKVVTRRHKTHRPFEKALFTRVICPPNTLRNLDICLSILPRAYCLALGEPAPLVGTMVKIPKFI
jgi:hypothetical protein